MVSAVASRDLARTRVRYLIVLMLFVVTVINYGDRAVLSIAGVPLSHQLHIGPVAMGYILSAFGWSYVVAQVPGGWLLDRYGTKWIYAASILLWSVFTLVQGWVGLFGVGAAVTLLFLFRLLVGAAEAPSFPGNARVVAAWFPGSERGMASAIFNSAQYFAPVIFAPLTAWVVQDYGWPWAFVLMGVAGLAAFLFWIRLVHAPEDHPAIGGGELALLREGGALMDMGGTPASSQRQRPARPANWSMIRQLLTNRMLLGVYIAQHCINVITYFFLTWFPIYLVKDRGMSILKAGFVASVPALLGFVGGILGGIISDWILRRTGSLTWARKIPIIGGMLLSMSIIGCNYVSQPAFTVALMALAFFGKGVGALGWAVVSDTSPRESGGVSGGLFNMFGNTAAITTPIIIGYIVHSTGSFNGALLFVGVNAFIAMAAYLVLVRKIERVELRAS